jgi:putative OPT family oligopeptide transporter
MSAKNTGGNSVRVGDVAQQVVTAYRELTVAAVVLGVIQGVVLNLAFVYAALKLGFSIGGSTVAAIMGYTLLRGVMGVGTMVENNINQTIASGINTAGTGVVFTVPALFLLQKASGEAISIDFGPLIMGGIAGAILGTMVIVPLRKQMIEMDRLRFPSGIATSTIIRAGSSGKEKAILLAVGFAISAIWKLVMSAGLLDTPELVKSTGFGIIEEELHFGFLVIPSYFSPVVYLSLMNLAAGLLAGRGGLPFFAGGALSWWVIAPMSVGMGWTSAVPEAAADGFIYTNMLRPLGIGVLVGGALMGVVTSSPAIRSAFSSLAKASKTGGSGGGRRRDELSLTTLIVGTTAGMSIFLIASMMTPGITPAQAVISTLVGTVWLALASLIVAQATGLTDISPMSGMSLISVTLMLILLQGNVAGAMVVGVAVCVAIGQAADMMQDLKTGFMIGARPIKQQIVQMATTWIGVLVALGAIYLLWTAGEGGSGGFGEGTALPAPQGGALAGIIESINSGKVPIDKYATGAVVGGLLGAAPQAGLGVLIGLAMYLPFAITLGYGIGCFLQMGIQKALGRSFCEHRLVPFAAGLIVGEALMGIGGAAYSIFAKGG